MDQQPTLAREKASARYKEGYNCAEAILRAFRDQLGLDIGDQSLRIASGFGGGLGQAGCMCGALSGAVMVLGLLQGRDSAAQSRDPIYTSAKEFHNRFSDHFGATCCRAINPHEFGVREQRHHCHRVIGETADLLAAFIAEKGLAPAGE